MKIEDFDYELPEELIAQKPSERRDDARLLVVHRDTGQTEHKRFYDILDYLKEGDCLVMNDSKVIPARLFGVKENTGAKVEFLLIKRKEGDIWETMVRPGRRLKPGDVVIFSEEPLMKANIKDYGDDGTRIVEFEYDGLFMERLEELGSMPLPPYIERAGDDSDKERYQTVYCREEGSIVPLIICIGLYTVLSVKNPLHQVDAGIMTSMVTEFDISLITLLPAVFILVLPMFKLDIRLAFIGSILSGFIIMVTLQDMSIAEALKCCIVGFEPYEEDLKDIIGGGGAVSMLETCGVIMLSCSYSGIFKGTDMLMELQDRINNIMNKTGRFIMMILLGIVTSIVFCSQTIAVILCSDLMTKPYLSTGGSKEEMAIDIENSTILISVMIPWNIACSVPLEMMGAGTGALMYSYLIFVLPVVYIFMKKIWFKNSVEKIEK